MISPDNKRTCNNFAHMLARKGHQIVLVLSPSWLTPILYLCYQVNKILTVGKKPIYNLLNITKLFLHSWQPNITLFPFNKRYGKRDIYVC